MNSILFTRPQIRWLMLYQGEKRIRSRRELSNLTGKVLQILIGRLRLIPFFPRSRKTCRKTPIHMANTLWKMVDCIIKASWFCQFNQFESLHCLRNFIPLLLVATQECTEPIEDLFSLCIRKE